MEAQIKINTDEIIRKFGEIEYSKLNDVFRSAIQESIQILKDATESNLRATGVNVNSPIRKGEDTFNPLIKGVTAEVSLDGTKGRVRVAPASKNGYGGGSFRDDNFALKWYEQGTKERFKKGKGYTSKRNSNTKQGGTRKHRNKGASTGMLPKSGIGYGFFEKAYNSTKEQVNKALEENINNAIQQIMNS